MATTTPLAQSVTERRFRVSSAVLFLFGVSIISLFASVAAFDAVGAGGTIESLIPGGVLLAVGLTCIVAGAVVALAGVLQLIMPSRAHRVLWVEAVAPPLIRTIVIGGPLPAKVVTQPGSDLP